MYLRLVLGLPESLEELEGTLRLLDLPGQSLSGAGRDGTGFGQS
jgi:hypothetical protein